VIVATGSSRDENAGMVSRPAGEVKCRLAVTTVMLGVLPSPLDCGDHFKVFRKNPVGQKTRR
jgi:hypothetical protein